MRQARRAEAMGEQENCSKSDVVPEQRRLYSLRSRTIAFTTLPKVKPRCRKRCEFTPIERSEMVQYLRNTGGYEGVRGTAVWKRMSVNFPNHTWQSLKEHFIKKIIPRLSSLCSSAEELDRFRQVLIMSNCNPQMIVNQYSEYEDNVIMEYVSREGKHAKLGGNMFWREMQSKNIVPARTWHSVRERYLKYLRCSILSDGKYAGSTVKYPSEVRETSQHSDSTEKHHYNERQAAGQVRKSKKRKLFTLTDRFDSNIEECGLVSEETGGPSVLDIYNKNQDRKAITRRKTYRALMKRRGHSMSGSN